MTVKQNIALKFLGIALMLVVCNALYTQFFFEKDLQAHAPAINMIRKVVAEEADVLYLGESSNISFREDDQDRRTISELTASLLPKIKMGSLTKEASHAGIYLDFLKALPADSNIKTIIVTMNLRSFGAGWIYSDLETALQKSTVLLRPYPPLVNRLLLGLKNYDNKTTKEWEKLFLAHWQMDELSLYSGFPYRNTSDWDRGMDQIGVKNEDGTRNQAMTELACHYIKSYSFQIDVQTNPRIRDFDAIVELAKKRHWKVLFHILPENIQRAQELVGSDLTGIMKANAQLLMKRYNQKNAKTINNLELVDNKQFIDQNWTSEHYAEKGRKAIAEQLKLGLEAF